MGYQTENDPKRKKERKDTSGTIVVGLERASSSSSASLIHFCSRFGLCAVGFFFLFFFFKKKIKLQHGLSPKPNPSIVVRNFLYGNQIWWKSCERSPFRAGVTLSQALLIHSKRPLHEFVHTPTHASISIY
jgi:hypothetical protein